MQVHIDTEDEPERERIMQRLIYSLNAQRQDIGHVRLTLTPVSDPLGTRLFRCRLRAKLRDGQRIELDETQSNRDLALTRVLERCARTARRRLCRPRQPRVT